MRLPFSLLGSVLAACLGSFAFAGPGCLQADAWQAALVSGSGGCSLHDRVYTCNWDSFHAAFVGANTVTLEAPPRDPFTLRQLLNLVQSQGKTVAEPGQPGDLTLLLIPIDNGGVEIGPSDKALATLRVYRPGPDSPRGTLLWAETFTGQPDRPWPTQVHALIEQFQEHLQPH